MVVKEANMYTYVGASCFDDDEDDDDDGGGGGGRDCNGDGGGVRRGGLVSFTVRGQR